MNSVADGDELLGLQRVYSARSKLALTIAVDVHDQSTAELMQEFYRGTSRPERWSARCARHAQDQRAEPAPYFWAPFVLVGKVPANAPT